MNHYEEIGTKAVSMTQLLELADLFKMFSDSTRIRIFYVLFRQELCVAEIAEALNMGQSAISHQLRLLRTAGLVKTRRDGKSIFYSLDDMHVKLIFEMGLQHILEKRDGHESLPIQAEGTALL